VSHHASFVSCQDLLNKKEQVGDLFNNLRLARQRSLFSNSLVNAPYNVHLGGCGDALWAGLAGPVILAEQYADAA
jgi:hypothetical protein